MAESEQPRPFAMEQGEEMSEHEKLERVDGARALYIGRVGYGKGAIDASEIPKSEFMAELTHAANECMVFVPDFRQIYGGCMDGRDNVITLAGNAILPRPKVIGAPVWFAWAVAANGRFSMLQGIKDPLKQFETLAHRLKKRGFNLGMHEV